MNIDPRDHVAIEAMKAQIIGYYTSPGGPSALLKQADETGRTVAECVAKGAYEYADAMLAESRKPKA